MNGDQTPTRGVRTGTPVTGISAVPATELDRPKGSPAATMTGDVAVRTDHPQGDASPGLRSAGSPALAPVDLAAFAPVPRRARTAALVAAALLAVLVPLLATLDVDVPGRAVLAVAYVFLVPGVPLVLALRIPSALVTTALAVATSLAVAVLYGTLTIVGGWWQPVTGAWVTTLVALVLSVLALRGHEGALGAGDRTEPVPGEDRRRHRPTTVPLVLLVLTGVVWWWSTRHLALDRAGALGLLPVAGWRYWLALVMVSALTAHGLLRRRLDHVLLTGCALLVALVGYATVPVSDGAGSVPVGWVHVAFSQYIAEQGTVATGVDARFSWPGFFSAGAQLSALAGTPDTRSFLVLAAVVNTMAVLPALMVLARAVTRSWRWAWVSVFVYLFTNWYQQDYFSPQATAFILYATVLGTLLWLVSGSTAAVPEGGLVSRVRRAVVRLPGLPSAVTPRTSAAIGLLLALLVTAVVVGHQLTPMTLILALVVFVLTGQSRYRLLWLFAAIVFAGWFSYGATDYWFGHLDTVFGDLGQVSSSVGAGVSDRLVGDPTYQRAQFVRIGWSATLFLAAAVGLLVLRRRPDVWLLAGLAAAPFGLLALQSYGGEGVIRSFLYASPLLAPLAAVALRSAVRASASGGPGRSRSSMALVLTATVLAAVLLTATRGLNVSFERTPPAQVAASELLGELIRPGDRVGLPSALGLTPALQLKTNARSYLDLEACDRGDLEGCLGSERPRFVLFTLTQERNGELLQSRPPGWLRSLGDELVERGGYREVYSQPDARLLESDGGGGS